MEPSIRLVTRNPLKQPVADAVPVEEAVADVVLVEKAVIDAFPVKKCLADAYVIKQPSTDKPIVKSTTAVKVLVKSTKVVKVPVLGPVAYEGPVKAPAACEGPVEANVVCEGPVEANVVCEGPVKAHVVSEGPVNRPVAYESPVKAPVAYEIEFGRPVEEFVRIRDIPVSKLAKQPEPDAISFEKSQPDVIPVDPSANTVAQPAGTSDLDAQPGPSAFPPPPQPSAVPEPQPSCRSESMDLPSTAVSEESIQDHPCPPITQILRKIFTQFPAILSGRYRVRDKKDPVFVSPYFTQCLNVILETYERMQIHFFKGSKETCCYIIETLNFDLPRPSRSKYIPEGEPDYDPSFVPVEVDFAEYDMPIKKFCRLIEFTSREKDLKTNLLLQIEKMKTVIHQIGSTCIGPCQVTFVIDITIVPLLKDPTYGMNIFEEYVLSCLPVESDEMCSICNGIRTGLKWRLPCGQSFHRRCIIAWLFHGGACFNCPTPELCVKYFYTALFLKDLLTQ